MSEWVSIDDKLPANGDYVLAFDGDSMCVAFVCDGEFNSWDDRVSWSDITHWMPLPEQPEQYREG